MSASVDLGALAEDLRARQGPLKQGYRDDPASALVESRATATVDQASISATIAAPGGALVAGLHPAGGGDGTQACSADIVLQAFVGCAGVTLAAVATSMGIELRRAELTATAHWDARGTLGVDRTVPVGLTDIDLVVDLDTDADESQRAKLVELTERYCVVAQTLVAPPPVTVRLA